MSANTYLVNRRRLPAHPAADCWPEGDAVAMADDIRLNGQQVPVVLSADGECVLDGRTRLDACEKLNEEAKWVRAPEGKDPVDLVIAYNEKRRHLDDSKRAMIAARLANLRRGEKKSDRQNCRTAVTQTEAAGKMNVAVRSVGHAAAIVEDPVLAPAVDAGEVAVSDAASIRNEPEPVKREALRRVASGEAKTAKTAAAAVNRETRQDEARRAAEREPLPPNLIVSAVADLHRHVEAGSVDFIITDPPYPKEYVEAGVYADLGRFATHALRPGGLLMSILPNMFVERVLHDLSGEWLRYRWMVAWTMPGWDNRVMGAKVRNGWKPFAVFVRDGAAAPRGYPRDWIDAGEKSPGMKEEHAWGQSEEGLKRLIEEWVPPGGQTVCDPFCGAGSTLAAAKRLGHRVIGADVDAAHLEATRRKLEGL